MDDRPQDRAEDRRRRGPLDDEGNAEETRRVPRAEGDKPSGEEEETRRIPPENPEREAGTRASSASEKTSPRTPDEEDPETRVIRTPAASSDEALTYERGYPEGAEGREERLREVYGGVDWLASFIGCIFAIICSGVLLALAGLVLGPLGFTLNLEGREIDTIIVTGLVIVGFALFAAYFLGGYVAGRLVRFDGGRNGAMTVLWGALLSIILVLFGSFLPGPFRLLQEFVQNSALPALGGLMAVGLVGIGIIIGALLLELLGGFLGGRLGHSYHSRIDNTP